MTSGDTFEVEGTLSSPDAVLPACALLGENPRCFLSEERDIFESIGSRVGKRTAVDDRRIKRKERRKVVIPSRRLVKGTSKA